MKNPLRAVLLAASMALVTACAQPTLNMNTSPDPEAEQALEAFPAEQEGYQRHVILLPALQDEDAHKVELIGGKTMEVDCNAHGMDGQFEQTDVQGWGYTYWTLQSKQQVRTTMMMCPDESKHDAFVQAGSTLIRYNSRLPVVVFVPEGMQLRYRVWQAGEAQDATAD